MSDDRMQLLEDMKAFLLQLKNNRFLWDGRWGFAPADREECNELLARYRELESQ